MLYNRNFSIQTVMGAEGGTISGGTILWFDCTSNSYAWYENGDNFHTKIEKKNVFNRNCIHNCL